MNIEQRPMAPMQERDMPFWRALREGRLTGQVCCNCGQVRVPPTRDCPVCLSPQSTLKTLSGRGTIVSACRLHRPYFKELATALPYVVILVRLDEGPLLYSNLTEEPGSLPAPGTPVAAVLRPLGDTASVILFEVQP
jgi:uncharacterized OB-fold protein